MKPFLELILKGRGELALVFAMIFILAILFVPIPAGLLDLLLIVNFSMAMLVLRAEATEKMIKRIKDTI